MEGGLAQSQTLILIWSVTDMENVRNFTQSGFFISKLYPKVRELCLFLICNKTA